MEAKRPPRQMPDSDRELITNAALIMGTMDMLRDRHISATFRERLYTIATEAIGRLAVIANQDDRVSELKNQLTAALEQVDKIQAAQLEREEPPELRKAA